MTDGEIITPHILFFNANTNHHHLLLTSLALLGFTTMYSKACFFAATSLLLPSAVESSYVRGVDSGQTLAVPEDNNILSRKLGWLSDMLSKAAKGPKETKTKKPTMKPTPSPTSSPVKETVADTSSPTLSPSNSPTQTLKNICLTNPEDIYRTCFQRAADSTNDLNEDTILRNMYNLGAYAFERGESTDRYLSPYTKPYIAEDEEMTFGTVYLSLVRENNTNVTCDDQLELEEISLKWLAVSSSD